MLLQRTRDALVYDYCLSGLPLEHENKLKNLVFLYYVPVRQWPTRLHDII